MNTFSQMWGIVTPAEAAAKIAEQRKAVTGKPRNLEEQAVSLVGTDIYGKLIKGYTEKQWGRSCTELPAFIIRRLPVRYTFDNNYFNDRYQGIPIGGVGGKMNLPPHGKVMRRDLFDAYCQWLFAVLFELEKRLDTSTFDAYNRRVFGFVGERLLDVWLEKNQIAYKEQNVSFMEPQNWFKKGGLFLKRKFFGK